MSCDIYTEENQPIIAKESRNINSGVAFVTIFRISKCLQRSKKKLFNYFSLSQNVCNQAEHFIQRSPIWLELNPVFFDIIIFEPPLIKTAFIVVNVFAVSA